MDDMLLPILLHLHLEIQDLPYHHPPHDPSRDGQLHPGLLLQGPLIDPGLRTDVRLHPSALDHGDSRLLHDLRHVLHPQDRDDLHLQHGQGPPGRELAAAQRPCLWYRRQVSLPSEPLPELHPPPHPRLHPVRQHRREPRHLREEGLLCGL